MMREIAQVSQRRMMLAASREKSLGPGGKIKVLPKTVKPPKNRQNSAEQIAQR
jgi:hypothetical protein